MSNPNTGRSWRTGLSATSAELLTTLRTWPWFDTLRTLRERFREDHLGLTASSLTFTTLIALVPLVAVMLAVFSAFPMFSSFQAALQTYFLQTLVPDTIAGPVLRSLTQFAAKASGLGGLGLLLLVATALALVLTIDRTLNALWRVRKPRPLGQRVLVYWAAMTLGPLALGVSLTVTSYAVSASQGVVSALPGGLAFLLSSVQFGVLALALAAMYRYVPNTAVRWRHAWAGALFVAIAFEFAKRSLAWYVQTVPMYSAMYGAFATVPILLLWVYLAWVMVLLGAVIAAYAPSLQMRVRRHGDTPGADFELALLLLQHLADAKATKATTLPPRGASLPALAQALRIDPLQLEPLLETLATLNWAGRLDEAEPARWVLLCDPAITPVLPLIDRLLLRPGPAHAVLRSSGPLGDLHLAALLKP